MLLIRFLLLPFCLITFQLSAQIAIGKTYAIQTKSKQYLNYDNSLSSTCLAVSDSLQTVWYFEAATDGYFIIRPNHCKKYLTDVGKQQLGIYAQIVLSENLNTNNQRWKLMEENEYQVLINQQSRFALCLSGNGHSNCPNQVARFA